MEEVSNDAPPAEAFITVKDERQAEMLANPKSFEYFQPFVAQDKSVSEAAAEAGCSLETMLYHVKKFVAAGLLKVTEVKPRAGRAIKLYRSVADAFFLPLAATPYADLEERFLEQFEKRNRDAVRALASLMASQEVYGQRIYRAADGEVWKEASRTAGNLSRLTEEIGTQMDGSTYLTKEEARAFQEGLRALCQKYQRPYTPSVREENRDPYLVSYLLVKLED